MSRYHQLLAILVRALSAGLKRDLPAPDEACARHHRFHQGVETPDLATIEIFFRLYIAMSYGRIVVKPMVYSINTNAEWCFAGFTRVKGTEINEKIGPLFERRFVWPAKRTVLCKATFHDLRSHA